mmetsp:Transcript_29221/g.31873  ORF Transcript_29221/g.31873 Transcript_29221/m.31873 type:complete len:92 (-) Transcript_29221:1119-1394(-)|eukprot:gene4541-4868_t
MSSVNQKDVPIVTAVPVDQPNSPPPINPTVVYATQAVPPNDQNERYGVCRKCRRVFERPPGVNDGQAQYFRCPECDNERWPDMIINSCVIS